MTKSSLGYLSQNTDITYFADGSIARALVEASNLEISRLQQFISTMLDNSFISKASGIYLDMFGEMLGVMRIRDRRAVIASDDKVIRFYVTSGTLGSRLVVSDPAVGVIPAGTTIQNSDGSVVYTVSENVTFPSNHKYVYVPAVAQSIGTEFNVGANQLTIHSLNNSDVKVTNDIAISSGTDLESDEEYRFRLSRTMTARYGSNATAVQLAAIAQAGVSRTELLQYSRGAGTFDVLVVPQGNRVSRQTLENTRIAVEQVVAFGISPKIKEPEYVPVQISIQLQFKDGTTTGTKLNANTSVQSAVLQYIGTIPLGGQLIINQLRATVLNADANIKDLQIVELCIDGHPRTIRNVQLKKDELFIPCEDCPSPIIVI